jgi:hypothetical protein
MSAALVSSPKEPWQRFDHGSLSTWQHESKDACADIDRESVNAYFQVWITTKDCPPRKAGERDTIAAAMFFADRLLLT